MKILFDARPHFYRFSGTGRYSLELAAALDGLFRETGDKLLVVASHANAERFAERGLESVVESPVEESGSLDSQEIIKNIAAAECPDVYHTPNAVCPPLDGIPSVLTLHDCIPLRCSFESTPQERIAFAAETGAALKACSRAIAVSETVMADAREYFSAQAGKISVVRHGVSKAFGPVSAGVRESVSRRLGLPQPFVLYVGNTLRHKNLVALFRGYARAESLLHGIGLVLGGFGCEPAQRHLAAIAELGLQDSVKWIGHVSADDVPALFGAASAFVMPSLYEGFSMPIAEAMLCGTPVACSDIAAFREICGDDAATYFDPENPESIAQGLVTATRDDAARARTSAMGLERAKAFDWHEVALKTLNIYKEVLGAANSGTHN